MKLPIKTRCSYFNQPDLVRTGRPHDCPQSRESRGALHLAVDGEVQDDAATRQSAHDQPRPQGTK